MAGGSGNDICYVDNIGDVVTEAINEGTDTVYASVSYALAAGSEVDYLRAKTGRAPRSFSGHGSCDRVCCRERARDAGRRRSRQASLAWRSAEQNEGAACCR